MRRHAVAALTALLLLTTAGSAIAAEPTAGGLPAASPAPTADPAVSPAPTLTPGPAADASLDPVAPAAPPALGVTTPSRDGVADPSGRWIVMLAADSDARAVGEDRGRRLGFVPDRTFHSTVRGFSARLSQAQADALAADPAVVAVVPDEKIALTAQSIPTGISRSGVRLSAAALIDGVDQRVNADVAIVDTGVARVADLNVAGGYNCSTSDRAAWRDVHGHGTHVAGTVGAIDNGSGVVGVAPGVRLWGVKILNDSGEGLLSWYVCGLDWITAQRDPNDPSRPLIESVNMSVAKWGSDDKACGSVNADVLHAAICRLVNSGVTVVAAAANDSGSAAARVPAAYNEVITVSALADTDGKSGGLGGARCWSWGGYDSDDTFADFSNFGSDVDIMAPGKCIWSTVPGGYGYMSGTSMAAPHVAGAAALVKAHRPYLTPAEVKEALLYLGNLSWKITSDPDAFHEKLLDVSRVGPRGDFSLAAGPAVTLTADGGAASFRITVNRTATSFERVVLRADNLPHGMRVTFDAPSLYGFGAASTTMRVEVVAGLVGGSYPIRVLGSEHGRVHATMATVVIEGEGPQAGPPMTYVQPRGILGSSTLPIRITWPAATDTSGSIAGYELSGRVSSGSWSPSSPIGATTLASTATVGVGVAHQYRVRARDSGDAWGDWATGLAQTPSLVQDTSASISWSGRWTHHVYSYALGGTERYSTTAGASARMTFSGMAIAIVAPTGPTRGSVRLIVDGVDKGLISLYSSRGQSRIAIYSGTFRRLATHTIELRVVGNGRVDLDAFVILR